MFVGALLDGAFSVKLWAELLSAVAKEVRASREIMAIPPAGIVLMPGDGHLTIRLILPDDEWIEFVIPATERRAS